MTHGAWQRAVAFAEEAARQAVLAGELRLQARALLLSARASAAAGNADQAHRALESVFQFVGAAGLEREHIGAMVTLADLIEAEVLTSERDVSSLLEEAAALAQSAGQTESYDAISHRLRAMSAASR
jgi:hypothetical protein